MQDEKLEEIAAKLNELVYVLMGNHHIEGAIPRIEKHLSTINGRCSKHDGLIACLEKNAARMEGEAIGTAKSTALWLKVLTVVAGGGGLAGIGALIDCLVS